MAKKRSNPKKLNRLQQLAQAQNKIDLTHFKSISDKMKFNFHFFDQTQFSKKSYIDLSKAELLGIGEKIIDFSSKSLKEWDHSLMATKKSKIYEIYGEFPSNSEFFYPKHVPNFVAWGRFRLGNKIRLCGFVIPAQYAGIKIDGCSEPLCTNTFYVVFYDHGHKFCPTG